MLVGQSERGTVKTGRDRGKRDVGGNAPVAAGNGQEGNETARAAVEGVAGDDKGGASSALFVANRISKVQQPQFAPDWPGRRGAHQSSPIEACMSARLTASQARISASYSAADSGSA